MQVAERLGVQWESAGASPLPAAATRRFAAFYKKTLPEVYRYFVHRAGSAAVAEDLTQETFLAVVASLRTGCGDDLSIPWIMGIARHKLIDHYRRSDREWRSNGRHEAEPYAVNDFVEWSLEPTRDRAVAALSAVSDDHRLVLVLRHMDGLSVPEIAELVGRSVHAVESLLVRAREAFKRTYMETFDD